MKLLERYEDQLEAEEVASALEAVGIPAYVSATNSHLFGRIQSGALKVSVWVALNHQFDDAQAYLKNPEHIVTTGLSPQALAEVQDQTRVFAYQFFNRVLLGAAAVLIVLALSVWWLVSVQAGVGGIS